MEIPIIELSSNVNLWIAYGLAFTLGLVVRDLISSFVQGALFKISDSFNEGDEVILDGEDAYIVSIGWRYTKFGIHKDDDVLAWRFIPNDCIKNIKLEKIVRRNDAVKWYNRRHPERNGEPNNNSKI